MCLELSSLDGHERWKPRPACRCGRPLVYANTEFLPVPTARPIATTRMPSVSKSNQPLLRRKHNPVPHICPRQPTYVRGFPRIYNHRRGPSLNRHSRSGTNTMDQYDEEVPGMMLLCDGADLQCSLWDQVWSACRSPYFLRLRGSSHLLVRDMQVPLYIPAPHSLSAGHLRFIGLSD